MVNNNGTILRYIFKNGKEESAAFDTFYSNSRIWNKDADDEPNKSTAYGNRGKIRKKQSRNKQINMVPSREENETVKQIREMVPDDLGKL